MAHRNTANDAEQCTSHGHVAVNRIIDGAEKTKSDTQTWFLSVSARAALCCQAAFCSRCISSALLRVAHSASTSCGIC